ncbi:Hypothetical predicted protein [Cloeon dipterum]|uniref:Uncharacterized protein n=1 Tax=Cloeon dipterum TaxID=197152 RepID=A0A8S1E4X0_9INSE|nr:Hypothetical predicted protein [Cloeon dipterum]
MELFALDTTKELNDPYFGSNFRFLDIVHVNDTNADMEFLWTSAAPCSKSDPLNKATNSCSSVTWCSNNVQTVLNYTLSLGTLPRPYCMIYRRNSWDVGTFNIKYELFSWRKTGFLERELEDVLQSGAQALGHE